MPTPEAAEAVALLIAARTRLTEITKKLNTADPDKHSSEQTRKQYEQLQQEWDIAFRAFEAAVVKFTDAIRQAKPPNLDATASEPR